MTKENENRDKRPYLVLLLPPGFISQEPRVFTIFTRVLRLAVNDAPWGR